jgi:integrase
MAKSNVKASLIVYASLPNLGWRRGSLVPAKTGYKPNAMSFNGREYAVPTPKYQIRTYDGSKAVYASVGHDLTEALDTLKRVQATRQLEAAQETLGIVIPKPTETAKTLAVLVDEYIAKKKSPSLNLSKSSIKYYQQSLLGFIKLVNREFPSQVTEDDVIRYVDFLAAEGYSQKTRTMRYTALRGFLRFCGVQVEKVIDLSTHKRLAVKIATKTDPYDMADLEKLFAVCDARHCVVFQFLLLTGLREREASHLTWSNVDFNRNVIIVPREQRVNRKYRSRQTGKMVSKAVEFEPKSRKAREVPIFASLRPMLEAWREQHPTTVYVFGTRSDMPDNHWLEYGKKAWKKAKLDCGTCDGCNSDGEYAGCDNFFLHRFRHSYGHRCANNGIPIHKLSRWMGHHSIEITAIYLSGGSLAADRDPFSVVAVA